MDHASHFGGMAVGISVAGYLRATGFHERRRKEVGSEAVDGVVDVGGLVAKEVKEVKDAVEGVVVGEKD